jgi:hypothetical protein
VDVSEAKVEVSETDLIQCIRGVEAENQIACATESKA